MVVSLIGSLDDVQVQRVLLVAAYAGVTLKVVQARDGRDNASESYRLNCHPLQQLPVMKTDEGYLFTIHAMVRYLARTEAPLRTDDTSTATATAAGVGGGAACDVDSVKFPHPQYPIPYTLYGTNLLSSAHVDAWLDFVAYRLDVHTLPLLRARSLRAATATTPRGGRTPRVGGAATAATTTTTAPAANVTTTMTADEEAVAMAAAKQALWPSLQMLERVLLQLHTQRKQLVQSSGGALTARTMATTEYDTLLLCNDVNVGSSGGGNNYSAHKRASMAATETAGNGGDNNKDDANNTNNDDDDETSRDSALYNNNSGNAMATTLSRVHASRQSQLSAVYNVTEAVETRMDSIARLTRSDEAHESIRRHTVLLDSTPAPPPPPTPSSPPSPSSSSTTMRATSAIESTTMTTSDDKAAAAATATTATAVTVPTLRLPSHAQTARSRSASRAGVSAAAASAAAYSTTTMTTVASAPVVRHDLVFVVGDSLTAADVVLAMGVHAVYSLPPLRTDAVRAFPHTHKYYKSILMLPVAAELRKALRMSLVTV